MQNPRAVLTLVMSISASKLSGVEYRLPPCRCSFCYFGSNSVSRTVQYNYFMHKQPPRRSFVTRMTLYAACYTAPPKKSLLEAYSRYRSSTVNDCRLSVYDLRTEPPHIGNMWGLAYHTRYVAGPGIPYSKHYSIALVRSRKAFKTRRDVWVRVSL